MTYSARLLKNIDEIIQIPINFFLRLCYTKEKNGVLPMTKQQIEELRQKYMQNPPEGMSKKLIKNMSDDDLLDMDYFLHEFDDDDEDFFGAEGFYIF